MRKSTILLIPVMAFFLLAATVFTACDESSSNAAGLTTNTGTTDTDTTTNGDDHEDDSDYDTPDTETESNMITLSTSYIEENSDSVTLDSSETVATITAAGDYYITGTLDDGQIIVNVDTTTDSGTVRLLLEDANITCLTNAPIDIESAEKTIIVIYDGTNTVTSSGLLSGDDDPNAALFSRDDLTVYGYGTGATLTVYGNASGCDGIASKDGLIIKNADISVSAEDDGIRGKDYVVIEGGTVKVESTGNGIKADNDENTEYGYVSVDSGTITVTTSTSGDAIKAETNVLIAGGTFDITTGSGGSTFDADTMSAKGIKGLASVDIDGGSFTMNTIDDAIHSENKIVIDGGMFDISTSDDALHANSPDNSLNADSGIEINGGSITITEAYEALESHFITVNDGTISIADSDDGFNATLGTRTESNDGSCIYLNGGTVYVNVSGGDALDSNGSIAISGGTVVAYGPSSQPNVGMDYNGTCTITGGLLLVTGPNSGHMIQTVSSSSSQYCIEVTSSKYSSSSFIHIQDEDDADILTFKPEESIYYIVFSSPDLATGSYSIYTGGSYSGGSSIHGLYTGGTYSGGSKSRDFDISGILTSTSF